LNYPSTARWTRTEPPVPCHRHRGTPR
jgi:hypothetical protein